MNIEYEEAVNSDSESLVVPPKTRIGYERQQIRESLRELERYATVERAASSNLNKLVAIHEQSIANLLLTGSPRGYWGKTVREDRVKILSALMVGMAHYAKDNPLAAHSGNDFSETNAVVMRNVSRIAGVSEADAAVIPDYLISRMRRLV